MKQIIDVKNLVTPKEEEKIFGGKYSGFQRYDAPKYLFADKIEEQQRNAFWNPSEISMVTDSQKFFELPDDIQEVMKRVWLFQTLMDSGQNKGLEEVLAEMCTNAEFEAMFKTWAYFELIHSKSYSHILRGIFVDSSGIFDLIADYPEIQHRIDHEISLYSDVQNVYRTNKQITENVDIPEHLDWENSLVEINTTNPVVPDDLDANRNIIRLMISVFFLEGIKFYVSFLVTYVINNAYGNKIPGATRIIKLINFDEDLHTEMSRGTLKILADNPEEGFADIIKSDWYVEEVHKIAKEVFASEMDWANYLLGVGKIPTLTPHVTEEFLKYYIDFRLQELGVPVLYNQKETDVVQWFKIYKDMNKDNAAMQESDLSVYSIGILKNDLKPGKIEIPD